MHKCVLDWYQSYLNHPGGSTLDKIIREVCYCKGLVAQAELYDKPCNICQQFKNGNNIYGRLPSKIIAKLKPWDKVHVYLIGLYGNYIRQHHPGSAIIKNSFSITCMKMINSATG